MHSACGCAGFTPNCSTWCDIDMRMMLARLLAIAIGLIMVFLSALFAWSQNP